MPSRLPSIDRMLKTAGGAVLAAAHGHSAATTALRHVVGELRMAITAGTVVEASAEAIADKAMAWMQRRLAPSQKRVINLTGTVLHTNLGRALLPEEAIEAAIGAMRHPTTLEFALEDGERGERDDHVKGLIREITGAEDCCLVNNNAAAVLLMLNTHGLGRETLVSRGELIEIGGSFRLPDIMKRAGTRLVEVGTTNRTHLKDYDNAVRDETGLILKAHTSNFVVQGFTTSVEAPALAALATRHGLVFADDLGSGTLVNLSAYGLPKERMVTDALEDGAQLVTFSGDKLLGGPQCGFIVGHRDLVKACASNPLKRTLRLDKIRLAALEATLKLYLMPDKLAQRLPTMRLLARGRVEIKTVAERLLPAFRAALGERFETGITDCFSQIGSGALPMDRLESAALFARTKVKGQGGSLQALAARLRALPVPIIGRISDDRLLLDLRCLEDEAAFAEAMAVLQG